MSPSNHSWRHKTRVFLLPHHEDHMILCSFVWTGYQSVMDRQTDGIAVGITALCIACKLQCGRAVKTPEIDGRKLTYGY